MFGLCVVALYGLYEELAPTPGELLLADLRHLSTKREKARLGYGCSRSGRFCTARVGGRDVAEYFAGIDLLVGISHHVKAIEKRALQSEAMGLSFGEARKLDCWSERLEKSNRRTKDQTRH